MPTADQLHLRFDVREFVRTCIRRYRTRSCPRRRYLPARDGDRQRGEGGGGETYVSSRHTRQRRVRVHEPEGQDTFLFFIFFFKMSARPRLLYDTSYFFKKKTFLGSGVFSCRGGGGSYECSSDVAKCGR